jgi:hypothetical protein
MRVLLGTRSLDLQLYTAVRQRQEYLRNRLRYLAIR